MTGRDPRWARFTRAAVDAKEPDPATGRFGRLRGTIGHRARDLRRRLSEAHAAQADSKPRHRPDIRLLPAVAGVWLVAAVAVGWPPALVAGGAMLLGGSLLLALAVRWRLRGARDQGRAGQVGGRRASRHRGPLLGATLLLAGVCILAVLAAIALRQFATGASDLAAAQGEDMALTLEVATQPHPIASGNLAPRVVFDAVVLRATTKGRELTGPIRIRVIGAMAWGKLQPGDSAGTSGRIVPVAAADNVKGLLRPGTEPMDVLRVRDGPQAVAGTIRSSWVTEVQRVWAPVSADVAGLLPGMVMGDRGGMDASLDESMKVVGLTHLTAVSGANCTLVLASLMLILRTLRAPRPAAAAAAIAGLAGFVIVVGPDASVLRAAVMGGIGAVAIAGGRPRRTGSLLAVSILVLLLVDPWLAGDFAFVLSVLATLGLHLVGRRCVEWLSVLLPLWLAQAVAIPLAAQLFCAPVIVLLQARLTPYTVPANMLAAPVVALVTTVGTLGMVLAALVPPLAALCAAASGAGAWWVATVAHFMSVLPAASLPWPAGIQGAALMALFDAAVLCGLVAVVSRERFALAITGVVVHIPARWRQRFGFGACVAAAAAATVWWTAAVVRL
ncbi:ComEC/Rec2 family competence protein [Arthrobacter sp. LAPM80]|uniref:ComEC/Rec2 family competence protein n=1 Tax=Arthrobacter sp. LAPM80 TaxID=3141788 RepID=UPI00398AB2FD